MQKKYFEVADNLYNTELKAGTKIRLIADVMSRRYNPIKNTIFDSAERDVFKAGSTATLTAFLTRQQAVPTVDGYYSAQFRDPRYNSNWYGNWFLREEFEVISNE